MTCFQRRGPGGGGRGGGEGRQASRDHHLRRCDDDVDRDVVFQHLRLLDVVHQLQVVHRCDHQSVLGDCTHPAHDAILELSKALIVQKSGGAKGG